MDRGEPGDAVVRVLPSRTSVALRLLPQIDVGLHDEDRIHVLPHDVQERGVALGERLLRVYEIQHGVGRRQEREGRAAVRWIDRCQPRRVGEDETALEKRRVRFDDDARRRVALGFGRVVNLAGIAGADGDEPVERVEGDPLGASGFVDGGRSLDRSIFDVGNRRGGRIDVHRQEPGQRVRRPANSRMQSGPATR